MKLWRFIERYCLDLTVILQPTQDLPDLPDEIIHHLFPVFINFFCIWLLKLLS